MTTWYEINKEIETALRGGTTALDDVRRDKLKILTKITGRPAILYASEISNSEKISAAKGATGLSLDDRDGFREAMRNIEGDKVDIIVQSPGGSPEATESIVTILRKKFTHIRFIVPSIAKSAATMLIMSGDEIILGDEAELGPTDPQLIISGVAYPAHAILAQFELAKKEIKGKNSALPAWLPILQQYGPSLLVQCKHAIKLSSSLVKKWLYMYMLKGEKQPKRKAGYISKFLSGDRHLSHNRSIDTTYLTKYGVNLKMASDVSQELADAILALHYSTSQTFARTGAFKIIENHEGKGLCRMLSTTAIPKRMVRRK